MFVSTRSYLIEWADCDPEGFVYHPNYFRIFDNSSWWLFRCATGMTKPELTSHYKIVGLPLVETEARVLTPCSYGEEVTMEATIAEFGRASMVVQHKLLKAGEAVVEGHEKRVWVARASDVSASLRAMPIPQDFMDRLK